MSKLITVESCNYCGNVVEVGEEDDGTTVKRHQGMKKLCDKVQELEDRLERAEAALEIGAWADP